MMRSLYLSVFISLTLISLSPFLDSVSCAGSSELLVGSSFSIPRTTDFVECSAPRPDCAGLYKCGDSTDRCVLQTCRYCRPSRGVCFPDYTDVPSCYADFMEVTITAAIATRESPPDVIYTTADSCGVRKQMVLSKYVTSSTTVVDIIKTLSSSQRVEASPKMYTAYDIQISFLYAPDEVQAVANSDIFKNTLKWDTATLFNPPPGSISSVDGSRAAAIFLNTSDWKLTPTTFAIQRCQDGTVVTAEDTCPVTDVDPALVAAAASSTKTSSTTRLLTIILPIVGGVVFITLIIAAVVIVRRRRANKVMRQTEKHTESAVEVTMA